MFCCWHQVFTLEVIADTDMNTVLSCCWNAFILKGSDKVHLLSGVNECSIQQSRWQCFIAFARCDSKLTDWIKWQWQPRRHSWLPHIASCTGIWASTNNIEQKFQPRESQRSKAASLEPCQHFTAGGRVARAIVFTFSITRGSCIIAEWWPVAATFKLIARLPRGLPMPPSHLF